MFDSAIQEFRRVVGEPHTLTGEALERYRWCTIPLERNISAVLRPASLAEIQEVLRIANDHKVPLYPISTGNNWGYGAALPAQDDNVILDLGRMNRIIEVNSDLAYAVVEPGVTQAQLYEYLQEKRLRLWLSPTGAGPSCSILGNTLERGFSIGPNGDHFQAQCGMEVVLAKGEILNTGFGHYERARATHVYKWGVGPYLDGLFSQSNLGIVTKIGVWLEPEPEHFEACYFTCNSESQLGPLIECVRRLLLSEVFKGPINILHRNRVLIMLDRYPWEQMNGQTPLSEAVAAKLASQKKIGAWNGVGAICGSRYQVKAAKQTIRAVLREKVDRLIFLSDKTLSMLGRHPQIFSRVLGMNVPELLQTLQSSYGLLKGIPTEIALSLAYWRNRRTREPARPLNPARDGCGIMWFAPVIPMTPADVFEFREIVDSIFSKYGFESCVTLTAVTKRCFDSTLPLLFDRDDPDEVRRAHACYSELVQSCRDRGFVSYRLSLQAMNEEVARQDPFWETIRKLKSALDPNGILAPGRYSR